MESVSATDNPGAAMAEKPEHDGLVTVPSDVILQELGDEIVVANLETGVYFALNEVAARTWALLRDAPSIDAVVLALLDEYEVDKTMLKADVEALLQQFQSYGLMHINHA